MEDPRIELLDAPWGDDARAAQDAIDRGRERRGLAPRGRALWDWRGACPAGAVLGVAREGERVAAAIAGVRHDVRLAGEPGSWIEVVDLFNDFEAGHGLARTRAFLALGDAFAKALGGRAPEGAPVIYGLPDRRAHRIGLAKLGQEILRSENVLVAPLDKWEPRPTAGVVVEEVSAFPEDDELAPLCERWAGERGATGAIGLRTRAWLAWRFQQHPERSYRIVTARRQGALAGYLVLRHGEYAGHAGGILADWVVLTNDAAAAWELLHWTAEAVRAAGGGVVLVNVPDKSEEWARFQDVAFQAQGTREYLVFRGFQKPYVMSWLFAYWHYTLADSERG